MAKRRIELHAQPWSREALEQLEARGLIELFKPSADVASPPPGATAVEQVYVSDPSYGPHRLICVGVNKTDVRLGVHPDREEILLPPHGDGVKPLYYVITELTEQQLREKDASGTLRASDFTCLNMYPAPRGTEMFTVKPGAVHCEATAPGEGEVGCFFVTEPRDLPITWIDLENHVIEVASP